MRAIAIATAGYRGAADLIDSMHQLRARIFRDLLEWTSKFGKVGKSTNSIPTAPHISWQ